MGKIKLIPKYATLKFNSKKEFDKWLKETTFKEIIFADFQQDLLKMWVAESGEILHCDFHSRLYNGKFVNIDELAEFTPLQILTNGEWERMNGLLIDEIKNLKL